MMYLCKFGQNILTRCSDKMQISVFLPWLDFFDIVFGIEKSSHLSILKFQVFGVHRVSFGNSQ